MKKLSPREKEVYSLWYEGLMNKQIAFDLELNQSTISEYKRRAFKKLGLNRNGTGNKCREMQKKQDDKASKKNVWLWKC